MAETAASRRIWFRKALVVPTEHGAWSWLLVPFLAGALVGSLAGQPAPFSGLALVFTLIGGLSAYMSRQPATALLRIRRGRGRKADESLALAWTLGFAVVAALCLAGLLALGRTALAALILPFAAVLVMYLLASRSGRAAMRALSMELTGAVGLALMAPAAYIAATGAVDAIAWKLWVLLALQNALGVLYVRVRLADTHERPASRQLLLGGHAVALLDRGGRRGPDLVVVAGGHPVRRLSATRQAGSTPRRGRCQTSSASASPRSAWRSPAGC